MVKCSVPKCTSQTSKGSRLFRFPRDRKRRDKWVQNYRSNEWQPTENSRICEIHFEESQFELNRADGRKLLKWNAIPTIFSFPNHPKSVSFHRNHPKEKGLISTGNENEGYSEVKTQEAPDQMKNSVKHEPTESIENLKNEIKILKDKLKTMEKRLNSFLRPDQVQYLQRVGTSNPYPWTTQTVRQALLIKCAVGVKGYKFLRSINYPLPSLRTLDTRIESCNCSQGI